MFIPYFDPERRDDYLRLSACLRRAGISNEIYPDAKKLGVQLKYADTRGFDVALIAGGDEWESGRIQVKTLATKESAEVAYTHEETGQLIDRLNQILA